ncbi:MAG: hypothetical protein ACE15F_22575 [bacterium]
MNLKKMVVIAVLVALAVPSVRVWLDKPYCAIELVESSTQKTKKNILLYAISKLISQRRDLAGNDPYRVFLMVEDPDGLASLQLTVDGKPFPLEWKKGADAFEKELDGDTEFGLHHYIVTATDGKGNTAMAETYITVSAPGGFAPVI